MPTSRALLALAAVILAACSPDAAPTEPIAAPPGAAAAATAGGGSVQRRLERAADGLLYTSESDYPFTYYAAPGRVDGPLTVDGFRAAAGIPADSLVEEVDLDAFFARHIENVDPADAVAVALVPRYERLREVIRRTVAAPRVYRVGRILIGCYVVGTDADGHVVGLATWAVET